MTQQDFDQRFNRVFKIGFGTLISGIALAIVVGAPSFALFGAFWPFGLAMAVCITGGVVCIAAFSHDIFFNPRWKQ